MTFTDTHTHLFDEQFDGDRDEAVGRALAAGVERMILPAIDSQSHSALISLAGRYPDCCFAAMGLHPTSVNDNPEFRRELETVAELLREAPVKFVAVGETGLDLHWSSDFLPQQIEALRFQAELALEYGLPLILHTRKAFDEIIGVLNDYKGAGLRGVFHSFGAGMAEYEKIKTLGGFRFGISGTVTYKNSDFADVVRAMDMKDILLETDSPYLAPVPLRGRRNESANVILVAKKVAEIKALSLEEVAAATTRNAKSVFNL